MFKISEHDLIKHSEGWWMTQNLTHIFLPCHWWNVHAVLQDTEGEDQTYRQRYLVSNKKEGLHGSQLLGSGQVSFQSGAECSKPFHLHTLRHYCQLMT